MVFTIPTFDNEKLGLAACDGHHSVTNEAPSLCDSVEQVSSAKFLSNIRVSFYSACLHCLHLSEFIAKFRIKDLVSLLFLLKGPACKT